MKKQIFLMVLLFAVLMPVVHSQQRVRVRLEEGIPMIPVAVPEFVFTKNSSINNDTRQDLYNIFWNDLKYSRVFTLVSKQYFNYIKKFDPDDIRFKDWASIQAKILVGGRLEILEKGSILLEMKVYDVNSEKFIFGRSFSGKKEFVRLIAHKAADEMMKHFGETPFFTKKIAFVSKRDGNEEIYYMDYDGKRATRITYNNYIDMLPAWSKDNEKLVYTSYRKGACDLYLFHLYTGKLEMLSTGGTNYSVDWGISENSIVFTSTKRDNNAEIYVMNMDTRKEKRITFNHVIDCSPCWSPNGNQIVFISQRSGNPHVYIMDAEGTNVRRITNDGTHHDSPDWSPDGSRIVYVSMVNWRLDLFIYNLKRDSITKLTENAGRNETPSWSPDGRHIIFASNRSGRYQIYSVDYDGMNLKQLTFQAENKMPVWQKK